MSHTRSVAVLGFTRFERETFESFFRLARNREPAYVCEQSLSKADFVIANADDASVGATLERRRLLGRTVLLGASDRPGVLLRLPRPINLVRVMRALDGVPRPTEAAAPQPPATAPQAVAAQAGASTPAMATPAVVARASPFRPTPAADDDALAASQQARRVLDQLAFQTGAIPANIDVRAMASLGAHDIERVRVTAAAERGESRFDVPANLQNVDLDLS